jgi:hypothetical protein
MGIPDGGVKTPPAIKRSINHQQKDRTPEINGEDPDITTQVHTRSTSAVFPQSTGLDYKGRMSSYT